MSDEKPFERPDTTLSPLERRRLRFRKIPIRVALPNLVTLLALSMGLTAIRYAVEERFETAVLAVMAAAVLDGLDGEIGAGAEGRDAIWRANWIRWPISSISEWRAALLLYFWALHEIKNFGWFAALAFAIACALRLARFNVMSEDPARPAWHGDFFVGMPSPAGAVTVLLPLYLHLSVLDLPASKAFVPIYIFYVLVIAFLMASPIPHFSGKRIGRVPRDLMIPLLFGGGVTLVLLAIYPMEILIALSLAYLALIPVGMRRYKALARQEEVKSASPA